MKVFTVHTKPGRPPILVKEGFSAAAFLFGPFWLLTRRAWIAAALDAALWALLLVLLRDGFLAATLLALAVLQGMFGRDLARWGLERRGFLHAHVVVAGDKDAAWARLLLSRPDIAERVARLEAP